MSFDGRIVKAIFFLPFTALGAVIGPMISLPVVAYEMLADIEPEIYSGPVWYVGPVLGIPLFTYLGWKTIYREKPQDGRFTIFGTARWANARECKALTDPVDGLLLGRTTDKGQALLRYDGVAHLLTLAPTRSGKGVGTIIPNLLTADRSVICIDPNGENARVAGRRRKTFGRVFTLDPSGVSGRLHRSDRADRPGDQASCRCRRHLPNDAAVVHVVGALMLETNDEWALSRRCMTLETLCVVSDNPIIRLPVLAA